MCGEKVSPDKTKIKAVGSPPRVRGKEKKDYPRSEDSWITPACAGKREAWRKFISQERDHPRVCGEKNIYVQQPNRRDGSPPRVRGKDE